MKTLKIVTFLKKKLCEETTRFRKIKYFELDNRNTRTRCEKCLKLTMKIPMLLLTLIRFQPMFFF